MGVLVAPKGVGVLVVSKHGGGRHINDTHRAIGASDHEAAPVRREGARMDIAGLDGALALLYRRRSSGEGEED